MKNTARVLIGGALVACGCGFFLYPNFREWNTQREVEQIIETFEKMIPKPLKKQTTKKMNTQK